MSPEQRTAVESAQLIAAFYKDNGYLPTRHTPASGEHKRLASALERLRRLEAGGTLPEDAARILYSAHPHWMDRSEHATERWQRTAQDFISWVQGNGRFPSQTAEDASERFLGRWLVRQREDARRERFPSRVRELDDRLPEWRETFIDQDRHSYIESAQLIAAHVQRHGTLPAPDEENSETARLAKVLLVLRNQKRRGLLAKEAVQTLDAAFPGWLDGITLNVERHWQKRAAEFIEWVQDNDRRPHRNAADPAERALAAWVARQRMHAKQGQYPARIKELNKRMPGWDRTP
ncbi:hypothetical protein HP499_14825 [Paenarthrobacter sp. CM16]|uniref:hypothetical protein n=1 Tax=Paenarthrobacter sp. CM16 TaxID=2738447 RepID=UPI001557BD5C|nr:hypothetical protein [Paenarthrobacter sp. CM16]NQD89068.1 hypothetical protein [Paenarthrobacter sp. CM16]